MKKFLGGLLAAIGLGWFCVGAFFCMAAIHNNIYRYWFLLAVTYGLQALSGLVVLWKGKKAVSDGEGSIAKKVSSVLMILTGIALVGGGIIIINLSLYSNPFNNVAGSPYIVLGIVLAIEGVLKLCAGKKAAVQTAVVVAEPIPQAPSPEPNQPVQSLAPGVMICPDCGKKYPLSQVYCDECGALLREI